MSKTLFLETPTANVIRSAIHFSPSEDEELFLLYSSGRQNGPGIKRDGRSSPWMTHPDPKWAHVHVTDPDLQRWGTWFLDEAQKDVDLKKLDAKIDRLPAESSPELRQQYQELRNRNFAESVYIEEFTEAYPDYSIIAIQGLGDLTMNHWNVGYLRSAFTDEKPEILHLLDEPIHDRTYSCLVKWQDRTPRYQICDVRFNRYVFNSNPFDPMVVQINGEGVADQIEFAVYGQQLVKPQGGSNSLGGGEVFDPSEIVHQFSDVRHLFQLPNLNSEPGRPRYFFGREQQDDIWLGEAELIENRNLRRAALAGSIELNRLHEGLGASIEQIQLALCGASYEERTDLERSSLRYDEIPIYPDASGDPQTAQWRIVAEDDAMVEIRLRENRYPCTMVGVDGTGDFYFYAWKGTYSQWPGFTMRQAARQFALSGVSAAILCDEGGDVFQYYDRGDGLSSIITPSRGQVRAILVVAKQTK